MLFESISKHNHSKFNRNLFSRFCVIEELIKRHTIIIRISLVGQRWDLVAATIFFFKYLQCTTLYSFNIGLRKFSSLYTLLLDCRCLSNILCLASSNILLRKTTFPFLVLMPLILPNFTCSHPFVQSLLICLTMPKSAAK